MFFFFFSVIHLKTTKPVGHFFLSLYICVYMCIYVYVYICICVCVCVCVCFRSPAVEGKSSLICAYAERCHTAFVRRSYYDIFLDMNFHSIIFFFFFSFFFWSHGVTRRACRKNGFADFVSPFSIAQRYRTHRSTPFCSPTRRFTLWK